VIARQRHDTREANNDESAAVFLRVQHRGSEGGPFDAKGHSADNLSQGEAVHLPTVALALYDTQPKPRQPWAEAAIAGRK
jgi:hypothetical protein